jgi:hypothetical protein
LEDIMTPQRYKTLRHMETVRNYLNVCIRELLTRGEQHPGALHRLGGRASLTAGRGHRGLHDATQDD